MRSLRAGLVCMLMLPGVVLGAPRIFVERPMADLGVLDSNDAAKHTFLIENRGDEPLKVTGISRCDGPCKSYVLERDTIQPGKSARLRFEFDLYSQEGIVSRERFVKSNDPISPEYPIRLSCRVVPRYSVEPKLVLFDTSDGDDKMTRSVRVIARSKTRKPLSVVKSDNSRFGGSLAAGKQVGTYQLHVETAGELKDGLTRGKLTLSSTDKRDVPCVVRVAAYVRPSFYVLPGKLVFDPVDAEQKRIVFVRQQRDMPIAIVDAVAPSDHFRCEINPGAREGEYRIYVHAWELSAAEGEIGALTMKTSDKMQPTVAIPVGIKASVITAEKKVFD